MAKRKAVMTDAERWRRIATHIDAVSRNGGNAGDYLCWYVGVDRYPYSDIRPKAPESPRFEQSERMFSALARFTPHDDWGRNHFDWCSFWSDADASEQRVWACLFLAAMADADGGNHITHEGDGHD